MLEPWQIQFVTNSKEYLPLIYAQHSSSNQFSPGVFTSARTIEIEHWEHAKRIAATCQLKSHLDGDREIVLLVVTHLTWNFWCFIRFSSCIIAMSFGSDSKTRTILFGFTEFPSNKKVGLERPCWRTYDNMWIDFIDIFEQSKDRQMFTVTKDSNDSSETRRTSKWDTLFQHFHFCFNLICWFLPHGCINSIELGATVAFKIKLQMNKPFIFIVYWSITLAYSCLQKIGKVQWALTSNSMANRVYNRQPNCMFYNHR